MSGLFSSTTIPGNRITDFAAQTATVGTPIPFGYGVFPVEETNVIWTAGTPVEHVTKKKQGKGGVKTEEYTYTLSYAIGVCQGPIYGFLIIKRNGKVVYSQDPNAPIDDLAYSAKWKQQCAFYLGTREQLPDSTIEATEGAGQVSAFRDLAYFVVEDDDVTDGGGAVPSYEVVVIATPPEVYLTSRPYPTDVEESLVLQSAPFLGDSHKVIESWDDGFDGALCVPTPLTGSLRDITQTNSQVEVVTLTPRPTGGFLNAALDTATLSDRLALTPQPQSGLLKKILVTSSVADNIALTPLPLTGSLST